MLRNQSIPAPSDMPPVEMVGPPIDWSAYVIEIEPSVSLAYLLFLGIYFLTLVIIQESLENWYD